MKTLLLILLFSLSTFAVNVSIYCTPDDGNDDSACLQDLIDDLPTGGTIFFDDGTWDLKGMVSFITYTDGNNSFLLQGGKKAIIKPDYNGMIFQAGSHNQLVFQDLIFVGDGVSTNHDATYLIYVSGGWQTRITGCQFIGVKTTYSLIYVSNTDLVVSTSLFHGLSSSIGTIEASNAKGVIVRDSEFIDYANLNGGYYSKTSQGVGAWIKAYAPSHATAGATANRGVVIENVKFDEGALKTAIFQNLKYVRVDNVAVNVVGVTYGAGMVFDNVRLATVRQSFFGYSGFARPAFVLTNSSKVNVEGITLGASVFQSTVDGTSTIAVSDCDGC
jgi:hypothetical protein